MKSRLTARSPLLKFSPRELPYKKKFNARRERETQKKDIDMSLPSPEVPSKHTSSSSPKSPQNGRLPGLVTSLVLGYIGAGVEGI